MKNVFTSLILCCICTCVMAQGTSTLIVFSEDGLPFDLILNGVKQNENHETNIRVEGLTQPYYNVKVLFKEKTLAPLEKKQVMVMDMDGRNAEATYIVKQDKKGRFKLKYYSAIPVESAPPAPENTTVVEFTTTPRVKTSTSISVTETTTTTISDSTKGSDSDTEEVEIDVNMGGMDVEMDVTIDVNDKGEGMDTDMNTDVATEFDANYSSSTTIKTTSTTTTTVEEIDTNPTATSKAPCSNYHMSPSEFQKVLGSLSGKAHEDSKLTVAKQISDSNCITPLQVGKIMKEFAHESTRLEFAIYAYKRVFDRSNYYKVNDFFQFESSIDDLNEALGL